jgi:hypothetical protein
MGGIQFVTDEKGRKVGVLIDLKKHAAIWEDFWDGLVPESRRKEREFLTSGTGLAVLSARGQMSVKNAAKSIGQILPRNQAVSAKGIGCARREAICPDRL